MNKDHLKYHLSESLKELEDEYWGLLEQRQRTIDIVDGLRIDCPDYGQWNAAIDTVILELLNQRGKHE